MDASAFVAPGVAGAPLFATVAVDITDWKRAEEELWRSGASLAQAQQISRTGWHGTVLRFTVPVGVEMDLVARVA